MTDTRGAPHVFLDRRNGRLALYLHGDLQFDAADERRYHEPLALLPVGVARARSPGRRLRVLVLGGGDGLALRDVLRVPEVIEAHVVDRDPMVVALGRRELGELNGGALDDPRVRVHLADAREVLTRMPGFDAVLVDLTYPREVADAALHDTAFYGAIASALSAGGVVGVNAVSPELTPQAFGCVAATLGAAGLASVPYAFHLPSFAAEGYGRWGFLFASARPIEDDELAGLALPPGVALVAADLLAATALPAAAAEIMRVAANRSDELLYYLANATPLAWAGPLTRLRFPTAPLTAGPRLTVAEGFARWLRQPEGARSLETLLACVPLGQRGVARGLALEWAHHAEVMFRGLDLRAFVEGARRRASSLPTAWRRELTALAGRLRSGVPSMRELLETTWRVFAVFLLALLLANVLFPDNLYAKGYRSGSSSSSSEEQPLAFAPQPAPVPFRSRVTPRPSASYVVPTVTGVLVAAAPLMFRDPGGAAQPTPPVLAVTKDVRLMENGALTFFVPVAGHHFLLQPDRIDVVTLTGESVVRLHPGGVSEDAAGALKAQAPLVERAMVDHGRWLHWAEWGAPLAAGRDARSEMAELERIRAAFARVDPRWADPVRVTPIQVPLDWKPVLPGVFLRPGLAGNDRELVVVHPDGTWTARAVTPPPTLGELDRFVYATLAYRASGQRDATMSPILAAWRARFDLPAVRP